METENLDTDIILNLSDIDELVGITPINKAITATVFGHNTSSTRAPISKSDVYTTHVFFVRPQLNLRSFNCAANRILQPLLHQNPKSTQRVVRALLDPYLDKPYKGPAPDKLLYAYDEALPCPIVNNQNPWLNLLSNTLDSLTGWPDLTLGTLNAGTDKVAGTYSQIDGYDGQNEYITLSATFNTMKGDINRNLMRIWYVYQSLLLQGKVAQYPNFTAANTRDFDTKIYVFNIGSDEETIVDFAATGPAFITNINYADKFNYKWNSVYTEDHENFSVEFKAKGVEYNEYNTLIDFNLTGSYFHPSLKDSRTLLNDMIKVPKMYRNLFNHRAIPIVNVIDMRLEWYVDKDYYAHKVAIASKSGLF